MRNLTSFKDLTGLVFGKWTVLRCEPKQKPNQHRRFWCRCECGTERSVDGATLTNGASKSCGCSFKDPGSVGWSNTPEYRTFHNAKTRCSDPKNTHYSYYGGRGIEFRFETFGDFLQAVGPRPSAQHSLDRIDNNGHYEAGNVQWATMAIQARNKSNNVFLTARGKTQTQQDWAYELRVSKELFKYRHQQGWCDECTINTPAKAGGNNDHRCPHITKDERPSNQFVPSWGEIGVFVFAIAGMWFFIAIWG